MHTPPIFRSLLLFASATAFASATLDTAPLESWIRHQSGIRTLQADFTQERKLASLKQPVTAKGHLAFARPSKMRWELGEPAQTVAISNGETLTLMNTGEKTAMKIPADHPQARQFTILAGDAFRDLAAFQQRFELVESRVTNGIYQLTVRPKEQGLRNNVPWMFLDIDPANHELRALELELKDKSRVRTIFTHTTLNPTLPASLFQADLTGYRMR